MGLREALIEAIDTCGMTRYEIWRRCGVEQATLSRLVNGQQGISIDNAEKVAAALGLEIVLRPARRTKGRR